MQSPITVKRLITSRKVNSRLTQSWTGLSSPFISMEIQKENDDLWSVFVLGEDVSCFYPKTKEQEFLTEKNYIMSTQGVELANNLPLAQALSYMMFFENSLHNNAIHKDDDQVSAMIIKPNPKQNPLYLFNNWHAICEIRPDPEMMQKLDHELSGHRERIKTTSPSQYRPA